jgi:hypothetical protein
MSDRNSSSSSRGSRTPSHDTDDTTHQAPLSTSSSIEGGEWLLDLLQCAIVAAGIIKLLTAEEAGRKRLMRLNAIDSITNGLRLLGSAASTCMAYISATRDDSSKTGSGTGTGTGTGMAASPLRRSYSHDITSTSTSSSHLSKPTRGITTSASTSQWQPSSSSSSTGGREKEVGNAKAAYARLVLDKLGQALVQLIAAQRNVSLDSAGRNQLLSSKAVCLLCSLMKPFKDSPDLLLNCARYTT